MTKEILEQLKIEPRAVTRLMESSYGSQVFRVDTERETFALKLFHGQREYWRERGSLEMLGPIVPKVLGGLPPRDGFDGALLMEFVEAENLASRPADEATAFAAGALLAQVHGHSLGSFGFFGARGVEPIPYPGWWSFRRNLLSKYWGPVVEKRLGGQYVGRCLDRLAQLSGAFRDDEPTCLTHCDFRFGNILRCRQGGLIAIDFESAREGDGTYDFIKIREQLAEPEWNEFLRGYASVRALPERLDAKLRYYSVDLNFGFLYWAIDRGDERLFLERKRTLENLLA